MIAATIFALAAGSAPCSGQSAPAQAAAVQARIQGFLREYSAKDTDGVVAMTAPDAVVYGSKAAEIYSTPQGIRTLLRSDFAQWDSATFGAIQHPDVRIACDRATAFFDAPITIEREGRTMTILVRFATVWRDVDGSWLLEQSANYDVDR
ncbi:MAG TPA: nuclear transport factor 2 family protein [Candidatus Baltobacteraceae bacterium]|nr:nuclear transport factor 2 family protein [Candidatus Baltobacteraceae bacterium]